MELNDFIENFATLFEETEMSKFIPETNFHELEEWSSLLALSVIVMAKRDYNVRLQAADVVGANTIADLYRVIVSKQ